MKKSLLILLIFLWVLASCKKDSESKVSIQVKDAITNSPVKGVTVGLHRCMPYEPFCGWIAYRTNITGDDGTCSFSKSDFDQTKQTQATRAGYWGIIETKSTLMHIYPEGWMRLRIIKGTGYPSQSRLKITMNYLAASLSFYTECNTAADSSILVRGIGGVSYKIDWQVVDPSNNPLNSGTWNQPIPRMDTVNAILNY
ncbi:MAG TPA: hypothetical protein VN451_02940 [Chitinophagaceae bacterium]|nr:hypothetical protein [Chitinophagaceae bacterium]